jgi:hypothetical protein
MAGLAVKPPRALQHGTVLLLLFPNAAALKVCFRRIAARRASACPRRAQAGLGRPHVAYEGAELSGPLKGVNFPATALDKWAAEAKGRTAEEELALRLVTEARFACKKKGRALSYIMAAIDGDVSTVLHEWAHAEVTSYVTLVSLLCFVHRVCVSSDVAESGVQFFQTAAYRELAAAQWAALEPSVREAIEKELHIRRYHPQNYIDEFQVWVSASRRVTRGSDGGHARRTSSRAPINSDTSSPSTSWTRTAP